MRIKPSLVHLMLLLPARQGLGDHMRLIPASVEALRRRIELELQPLRQHDRDAVSGESPSPFVNFLHPNFLPADVYPTSRVTITSAPLKGGHTDMLMVGLILGHDGEQLENGWRIGLQMAPVLAAELGAGLGFLNGGPIEDDRTVLPPDRDPRKLPSTMTPWTYIGPDLLDPKLRSALEALPAFVSEPVGDGWQVRAVESIVDEPSPGFRQALREIADEPIVYMGPRL